MRTLLCDLCGKRIDQSNFDPERPLKVKVKRKYKPQDDMGNGYQKLDICGDCARDIAVFGSDNNVKHLKSAIEYLDKARQDDSVKDIYEHIDRAIDYLIKIRKDY